MSGYDEFLKHGVKDLKPSLDAGFCKTNIVLGFEDVVRLYVGAYSRGMSASDFETSKVRRKSLDNVREDLGKAIKDSFN
jgi:hypothetical protein